MEQSQFQVFGPLVCCNLKAQFLVNVIFVSLHENFLFYFLGMKCQKGRNENWCSFCNALRGGMKINIWFFAQTFFAVLYILPSHFANNNQVQRRPWNSRIVPKLLVAPIAYGYPAVAVLQRSKNEGPRGRRWPLEGNATGFWSSNLWTFRSVVRC